MHKQQKAQSGGESFSRDVTKNVQFSTNKYEAHKETGNCHPYKGKKQDTQTICDRTQISDLTKMLKQP